MNTQTKPYDVFISHASEDKDTVVRALAAKLDSLQIRVWYDEFSLKVGDSLSASIDHGLRESRYGVVIISQAFLKKQWTDYEYRSLVSRQVNGEHVILPIWHGVTKEEVLQFSPFLADIKALNTTTDTPGKILQQLVRVIRPDIYRQMCLESIINKAFRDGKRTAIPTNKLVSPSTKLSRLTEQQRMRAKAIYYGIGQHLNMSFQNYIDLYELDLYPEHELQSWEMMNACYMEYKDRHPNCPALEQEDVFRLLLGLSVGSIPDTVMAISDERIYEIAELWKKNAR